MVLSLLVSLALGFVGCATHQKKPAHPGDPVVDADTIVWVGLDYSMVRMIGTGDFRQPDQIFPRMFETWNYLFVREDWTVRVGEELKKEVVVDTSGMSQRNRLATPDQILRVDSNATVVPQSHISALDIAHSVRSYELKEAAGVGLVFIVDRLVKEPEQGCVYFVFFDITTREVLRSERGCYDAGGGGFRNYWFSVIKEAVEDLSRFR